MTFVINYIHCVPGYQRCQLALCVLDAFENYYLFDMHNCVHNSTAAFAQTEAQINASLMLINEILVYLA